MEGSSVPLPFLELHSFADACSFSTFEMIIFSLPPLFVIPVLSTFTMRLSAVKRDLDASYTTDPSQYYRLAFHSSECTLPLSNGMLTTPGVLLGKTLYRDGGDFSSPDNYLSDSNKQASPLNSTYSLDLSTSWSPSEAVWNVIDKGNCPILNRPKSVANCRWQRLLLLQWRCQPGRLLLSRSALYP